MCTWPGAEQIYRWEKAKPQPRGANSSLTAGDGSKESKEEGGGSTGAGAASVTELTALGTRWGINKQCSFPVLLLQIS